jgi:hypothetical protein
MLQVKQYFSPDEIYWNLPLLHHNVIHSYGPGGQHTDTHAAAYINKQTDTNTDTVQERDRERETNIKSNIENSFHYTCKHFSLPHPK